MRLCIRALDETGNTVRSEDGYDEQCFDGVGSKPWTLRVKVPVEVPGLFGLRHTTVVTVVVEGEP